ncbi:MAG TPA: DUF4148 domain-containing protein [Burkholderiaceae bacterium]
MNTKSIICATLILSFSVCANAQQAVAGTTQGKSTMAAAEDNTARKKVDRKNGKTRSEVLAELEQAETEGKAMPSGFVAYDDAAHDAKYNTITQHVVAY